MMDPSTNRSASTLVGRPLSVVLLGDMARYPSLASERPVGREMRWCPDVRRKLANARVGGFESNVERDLQRGRAHRGEGPAAGRRLCFSGAASASLRKA